MLTLISNHTALELCDSGEYRAAAELAGLRVGERPENVSGDNLTHAEALLVAGIISSTLGGIQQSSDQAPAREMLTESIELFGSDPRSHLGRYWLAWADYWDADFDAALGLVEKILAAPVENKTRFRTLLLRVIILSDQGFPIRAFAELEQMVPFYDSCDPLLKGKFHLQRGKVFRQTNEVDRAIIEYYAAINFYQEAQDIRGEASAANNLAGLYLDTGQYTEAHEHAERARILFRQLGDKTFEAKAWDQTALIFLAEGKLDEATEAINQGITLVEHGEIRSELEGTSCKIKQHAATFANDDYGKIRAASRSILNQTCGESSAMMAPLECASHLIQNYPEDAGTILDLLIWATSDRDNPKHEADLNIVKQRFYIETTDCVEHWEKYQSSRLLREVKSDS